MRSRRWSSVSPASSIFFFFFFNDPAPTEISPLSLHDPLPIFDRPVMTDLTVAWEGVESAEASPALPPDLPAGEPLFLSARLTPGGPLPRLVLGGKTLEGT